MSENEQVQVSEGFYSFDDYIDHVLKTRFSFALGRKLTRPYTWSFDGQHSRELGTKHYPLSRVRRDIEKMGRIVSEYFCPDYSYHYFFGIDSSAAGAELRRST